MDHSILSRDELILQILEYVCKFKDGKTVNAALIQRDLFQDLSIDDIEILFEEMHGIPGLTVMLGAAKPFLRYQLGLEHYVNDKKKMTKKEKLHRIVEFLSIESKNLNQDCFNSQVIAKAFSPELNIYETNALCRLIIDNKDLRDCTTKDTIRDTIAVMVITRTREAYFTKKYLEVDETIITHVKQNIVNVTENTGNISAGDNTGEMKQEINPVKTIDKPKELPFWTKWFDWVKNIFGVVMAFFGK